MNYYFVLDGEVMQRASDRVPDNFNHPVFGSVSGMSTLDVGDLAALGWFQGVPAQGEPPHDSETEKCYVQPTAPEDVAAFLKEWALYKKALVEPGPAPALPRAPVVVEQWVVQPLNDAELQQIRDQRIKAVRDRRNMELLRTDFLMLADSPVVTDPAQFSQWKAYRQALRDLPAAVTDPSKVAWPPMPAPMPDVGSSETAN